MLNELLKERDLLPILTMNDGTPVTRENWPQRRAEMLEALEKYSYGRTPPKPKRVWGEILEECPWRFTTAYGGKVHQEHIRIHFETDYGICTFPFVLAIPNGVKRPPVMLTLSLERNLPNKYVPVEEIIDNGFALAAVCHHDIVNDRNTPGYADFSDGIAAHFGVQSVREPEEWGKVGMWAYGLSRILDYLLTRDDIDAEHTAVIGHSRGGKTALWAAAQDERFYAAISNNSGYGGAATAKYGEGEKIKDFFRLGSWVMFCENFKQFADKEDEKPYDQAYLLALIAPRLMCVGSAVEDQAADPKSEFLTSLWASQAWELFGEKGLVTPDRLPVAGDVLQEGKIGYHMRHGDHFLSREDWNYYFQFLKRHHKY